MSYNLAHHAIHTLGSRALGFSQEMFDPVPGSEDEETSDWLFDRMASDLPLFVEFMEAIAHTDPEDQTLGWCENQTEFEFAVDRTRFCI
ncbi:MAG TPA: hypothetical protein VE569_01075 [Acidimicrobiia bacterium]|nr:hypothetical protein [Acidimicrobiia bacterium]